MLQPSPPEMMKSRLLPDVTIGEAIAEARGHDRRPAKQPELAAMRMAGQHERHALRHAGHDVGLMRHEDDRPVVRHLRKRTGEIVDADRTRPNGADATAQKAS